MSSQCVMLVWGLLCYLGRLELTAADTFNSTSLLKCILASDPIYDNFEQALSVNYGCFCRTDGVDFNKGPIDDVDQVCKEYWSCLDNELSSEDCSGNGYTIYTMPTRFYDKDNPSGPAGCMFSDDDYCDAVTDRCARRVCGQCDSQKIEELKDAVEDQGSPTANPICT